jgi:plasmid maintenance system killer protein
MELAFTSKQIRRLCEDINVAQAQLGNVLAAQLVNRLSDIGAANYVDEIIAGKPRLLKLDGSESYCIDLGENYRIIFISNHTKDPQKPDGAIDWSAVSRVQIKEIGKYDE